MTVSTAEAKKIAARTLAQAKVGDVRVKVEGSTSGFLRFAESMPTSSGDIEKITVSVTATVKGGRHATVKGNKIDDAGLEAIVRQAEAMAEVAPPDPEHMGPLGRAKFLRVMAVDRKVAAMSSEERAKIVQQAIEVGTGKKLAVSGFLEHNDRVTAVADRAGLSATHRGTQIELASTCRTQDGRGSSKAGVVSHRLAAVDGAAVANEAARWALQSQSPGEIEMGKHTVVLAPQAVADLLDFLVESLDHRQAYEGRTFFAAGDGKTKIGETLFDTKVDLWSDPADRADPSSPIARDGRPHPRVDWVKSGRLVALTAERFWADKVNVPSRPEPGSVHMKGGKATLDELVASVDKGVLVTRFWYNRMLSRPQILVTGMTRDGTFLIEGGKIARPIKNMRYNESPVTMLGRATALGVPVRAGLSTRRVVVVPPIVVDGFNFDSMSDAV
jgi:predicted Zn-dependent protease